MAAPLVRASATMFVAANPLWTTGRTNLGLPVRDDDSLLADGAGDGVARRPDYTRPTVDIATKLGAEAVVAVARDKRGHTGRAPNGRGFHGLQGIPCSIHSLLR